MSGARQAQETCLTGDFVTCRALSHYAGINHGSSVYIASLDASKAFDGVHHTKLFNKLLERGLPGRIRVLIDWYGKLFCLVKWNGFVPKVV